MTNRKRDSSLLLLNILHTNGAGLNLCDFLEKLKILSLEDDFLKSLSFKLDRLS
jgi:hypothetical protein